MSSDARTTTPTSHNTASETPPSGKSLSLTISAHKSKSSAALHKSRTPLLNGTKRSHTSLHEFENDVEETEIQSELVSLFDHAAGGAIGYGGPQAKGAPLVITRLKNRDWREESRRKRGGQNLLPREVQEAQRNGVEPRDGTDEAGKGDGISETYGLTFLRTENKRTKEKESTVLVNEVTVGSHSEAENENEGLPPREKTDDEVALEALTSGKSGRVSTLLLPALETSVNGRFTYGSVGGISEDDAFRADVLSRPDSASMADYASVPVEEFGAALLRGMGWKEGEVVGKRKDAYSKPRTVERRPALLGLGAKDVPSGIGEELGAWGKAAAAKGKSRRPDLTYNPVVLKNSRTGEMLTEEELMGKTEERAKSKKESEERKEDWRDRRDRNLRIDAEKKDRDRGDVGSGYVHIEAMSSVKPSVVRRERACADGARCTEAKIGAAAKQEEKATDPEIDTESMIVILEATPETEVVHPTA